VSVAVEVDVARASGLPGTARPAVKPQASATTAIGAAIRSGRAMASI
jgi:hypothetical protein